MPPSDNNKQFVCLSTLPGKTESDWKNFAGFASVCIIHEIPSCSCSCTHMPGKQAARLLPVPLSPSLPLSYYSCRHSLQARCKLRYKTRQKQKAAAFVSCLVLVWQVWRVCRGLCLISRSCLAASELQHALPTVRGL